MEKKWFFIEEVRSGFTTVINSYPVFGTEEDLPKKIKEENERSSFKLFSVKAFELTPKGEKVELKTNFLNSL